MPYIVVKRDNEFCVYKKENGEPSGDTLGCHDTEEKAKAQVAAIWASENAGKDLWLTVEQMRAICPDCAERMTAANLKSINLKQMSDAALQGLCKRAGSEPGFWTSCAGMSWGPIEDTEGFCAWLHFQCVGKWPGEKSAPDGDTLVSFGGAVKALGDGWVEGPLVLFTSPDDPDLVTEYFDARSDLGNAAESACYYEHGLDPLLGKRRLGLTGKATLRRDEFAEWAKVQLDLRDRYEAFLYQQAEKGKLGWSSGTAPHLVERVPMGKAVYIKSWPLGLDASLTLQPCEPRNAAIPLKSWQPVPLPEAGAQDVPIGTSPPAAEGIDAAVKIVPEPTITGGATMPDNVQVQNQTPPTPATPVPAPVAPVLVDAHQVVEEVIKRLRPVFPTQAGYVITDAADRALQARPYKSLGEFLQSVARGPEADPRLLPLRSGDPVNEGGFDMIKAVGAATVNAILPPALKAASGLNETVPSQGGFLVGTDRVAGLLARTYETGAILSRVDIMPISPESNGIVLNAEDETSRAAGYRRGGIRAYWADEATEKTSSKPKFRQMDMKLKKIVALCYATDELLADTVALGNWIGKAYPEEITFIAEDAIWNGTGAGMPLGILNSNALVSVAKESGQAAATVVAQNIIKMWARCWSRSRLNAAWYINQDIEPQLYTLNLPVGTGGQLVYMPAGGLSASPYATLFNRPVVPIEYAATLGTVGDIVLADLNEYQMINKGGVEQAASIHVRFIYDETVYRFVYRINGEPKWSAALTPFKGSNTLSPFVALAIRA